MKMSEKKRRLMGLKAKFLFLVLLPVLVTFAAIGYFSRENMFSFGKNIKTETTTMVTDLAEKTILEKARSVAREFKLALKLNPGLKPRQFDSNKFMHEVAIQKVGKTGYTCLYATPDHVTHVSPLWIHPNKKLIGRDTPSLMKKPLGSRYRDWFSIYKGAYYGEEAAGYYLWADADNVLREKYMACVPVKNTPYIIAATTYLDDFLTPIQQIEQQIGGHINGMRDVHLLTMAVGLVLIICFVIFSIQRLTRQIVKLTKAIIDVSTGEVDSEIEVIRSNDEIQDLSEAFERMRTGVKFTMKKLQSYQRAGSGTQPTP